MKSYEEKEPQEFFKEVCTEAIGRFEALKEFCFYARQEDELEVNLADAVKMIVMTERTAKVIAEITFYWRMAFILKRIKNWRLIINGRSDKKCLSRIICN